MHCEHQRSWSYFSWNTIVYSLLTKKLMCISWVLFRGPPMSKSLTTSKSIMVANQDNICNHGSKNAHGTSSCTIRFAAGEKFWKQINEMKKKACAFFSFCTYQRLIQLLCIATNKLFFLWPWKLYFHKPPKTGSCH